MSLQNFQKSTPIGMIKKEWIQNFKNIYEFNLLYRFFLEKIKEYKNIKDYNSLTDDIIEEIIEELPNEYIDKIKKKKTIMKLI